MFPHAIILTVLVAFGHKGVESIEEATYISGILSTAVCSGIDSYSESRTLKHPRVDHADRSNPASRGLFQRNQCGGKNCDPTFAFTPVESRAGRIPIFGPQSQVNFSVTKVGAYENKLYVYVADPVLAWPLALAACMSNGMQLVDVESAEEMNKLADLIWSNDNNKESSIKVWTGGHRFTAGKKTREMDWYAGGKRIPLDKLWNVGQPKIVKGADCVQMDNDETRSGFKLRDVDCRDNVLPFICETML